MRAIIVGGNGSVGRSLSKELLRLGHQIEVFSSGDDRCDFSRRIGNCDGVFIAIPTKDCGEIALGYIIDCMQAGKPVVTCEKGSMAWQFPEVREYLDKMGFNATVGGGSGMLNLIDRAVGVIKIFGVINATTNFIFSKVFAGESWESAITEAKGIGLCEPNSSENFVDVIRIELDDILLKTCILFNLSGVMGRRVLRPKNFSMEFHSDDKINEYVKNGMKLVVYIGKNEIPMIPVFFTYKDSFVGRGKWLIQAGFVYPRNFPEFSFPSDKNNTLFVEDYSGVKHAFGVGAGPDETAGMMVADMNRLMQNQNRSLT